MKNLLPLIAFVAFLTVVVVIFDYFPKPRTRQTTQNQEAKSSGFGAIKETQVKKDFTKLIEVYNQNLSEYQVRPLTPERNDGGRVEFGITYLDLETGEKAQISGDASFHAASTTKPIVAVYALKQVGEGKLSLEQKIGDMPLFERLRLMINISDNNSWEELLKFFGILRIQKFSDSLGLSNTNQFKNTSTTNDLADFLAKLYQGEILSQKSREFLLDLMQKTETEDRIPAGIPAKKLVFHKAGTFEGEVHDIGIIAHPKNPFVLAILSNGLNDLSSRPKILAQIAKVSWDFAEEN